MQVHEQVRTAKTGRKFLEVHTERVVRLEDAGRRPPCTPRTARCYSTPFPFQRTRACCRAHNVTVLGDVAAALDDAGVPWWIDYGTLLGYQVNGGFYWNDKDTDIGVLATHRDVVLELMQHWRSLGRYVHYKAPSGDRWRGGDRVKVRLSAVNHNNCDIFFWEQREDGLLHRANYIQVDRFKGREFPPDWILPLQRGMWEGIDVSVPAQPEKLVAHRYGDGWRELPAARTDGVRR